MKSNTLGFAFLVVVLSISYSCNIQKRVEKQQKVFDNIGREWLRKNPCANDSFTIYVPGKRDSIPIEIPIMVVDSDYIKKQLDSLQADLLEKYSQPTDNCSQEIKQSYNAGYNAATKKWEAKLGQIKVALPVVDTLKITLKDKQAIQLLQNDLAASKEELNKLNGIILITTSKKDKWFLWFVITFILLSISIYFHLKK
jgi:hypothetical protein